MHQSAECGMQAFLSSFPHVKDRVLFDCRGQRKVMRKLLLLLYNMRTKRVGVNQILNVYTPSLHQNVNERYVNTA